MAPLVVYVAINHEKYIGVRADALKLSAGGLICAALVLFKILGKLKAPSSTVCLGIFFILSYLLKSITDDLIVNKTNQIRILRCYLLYSLSELFYRRNFIFK